MRIEWSLNGESYVSEGTMDECMKMISRFTLKICEECDASSAIDDLNEIKVNFKAFCRGDIDGIEFADAISDIFERIERCTKCKHTTKGGIV